MQIKRVAQAFDVGGIILCGRQAKGFQDEMIKLKDDKRTEIPVSETVNLTSVIRTLKKSGFNIGSVFRSGKLDISQVDFAPPIALLISSGFRKTDKYLEDKCDFIISINSLREPENIMPQELCSILLSRLRR